MARFTLTLVILLAALTAVACSNRRVGTPRQVPPGDAAAGAAASQPPAPPRPVEDTLPAPPPPLREEVVADRAIDDLNRESPLAPVLFPVDSAELDAAARAVVTANAELLSRYPTWTVTVEGHCDERGTPEYNLALGERRAGAVKTYLTSLGVAPERVRTVSYGKEFPFDPGHTEAAWAQNRRSQFVVTSR